MTSRLRHLVVDWNYKTSLIFFPGFLLSRGYSINHTSPLVSPNYNPFNIRRTSRAMTTIHRLKLSEDPSSLQDGHKAEVEVDGIEGAKLLLLKVEGNLRVLSPRCTRMFHLT